MKCIKRANLSVALIKYFI